MEDRDRMMTNITIIIKKKQQKKNNNKEFGKPEKGRKLQSKMLEIHKSQTNLDLKPKYKKKQ